MYGPAAHAEIFVNSVGSYNVLIAYRNPHDAQCLRLRLNGEMLGAYELATTGLHSSRVLMKEIKLDCERNLLHFEFSRWYGPEQNARPLAIMLSEILIEKVSGLEGDAWRPRAQLGLTDMGNASEFKQ